MQPKPQRQRGSRSSARLDSMYSPCLRVLNACRFGFRAGERREEWAVRAALLAMATPPPHISEDLHRSRFIPRLEVDGSTPHGPNVVAVRGTRSPRSSQAVFARVPPSTSHHLALDLPNTSCSSAASASRASHLLVVVPPCHWGEILDTPAR